MKSSQGRIPKGSHVLNPKYSSREEFRKILLWISICHAILVALVFMYVPAAIGFGILTLSLAFNAWAVIRAPKDFDYLKSQHRIVVLHFSFITVYFLVYFTGAAIKVGSGSPLAMLLLFSMGGIPWAIAARNAWNACERMHAELFKPRTKSMDWKSGVYDVASDSLSSVDLNRAILGSSSAWKWSLLVALGLSPGPIFGVMAGKISEHFRFVATLPAAWCGVFAFGFLVLRFGFDYRVIRRLESEHKIRLVLSTSSLAKADESTD